MKKTPVTTSTDAGKKTNATSSTTTTTTMKRKDTGGSEVVEATSSTTTPSSILPKKGRYKDDTSNNTTTGIKNTNMTSNNHMTDKSWNSNGTSSHHLLPYQQLPQNHVQFTFGELPDITTNSSSNAPFRATIFICKRTIIQHILTEGGNELITNMLGISIDNVILQSMFTDCGGINGTSKSVSVASTYVDITKSLTDTITPMIHQHHHHKLYLMILPETVSRCNHTWSVHGITDAIKSAVGGNSTATSCRIVWCGTNVTSVMGSLTASIARAFHIYTRKTKKTTEHVVVSTAASSTTTVPSSRIHISFMNVSDNGIHESIPTNHGDHLLYVCESIQLAARLVDMPPEELTTTAYAEECRNMAASLPNVTYQEIVGEDLDRLGYGGLYGIGKAATCPPRLVILEYIPESPYDECVALVGKGIVYDTGGLSLKSKDGMPGMKYDMGGSAGVFGGFVAAVKMQLPKRIVLLLCLAENAIGPEAVRNDDILTMYSGKTVEVNNTDAEGRLVLADGVAHASKHYKECTWILDMATLTGAQLVAAGKTHAGILTNTIELEHRVVEAGLKSGDLVVPLLYAPEFLMKEFDSKVADMKNSVKDRGNAQASCAGHFIESHLHDQYTGGWIHVDMAGPGDKDGRGTGYGVALILALLNAPGF